MADSLWMRLRDTPWDQYDCAPGTSKKPSKLLENLSSRKLPRAMKAGHELWSALCSGEVRSAAEPCAPFLVEILGISSPGVQSEILDILIKISDPSATPSDLTGRIRANLQKHTRFFGQLANSPDQELAQKTQLLIKQLG